MFFGLDFRQCLFSVLAILAAVGIYFGVHNLLGEEVTGWLCVFGVAPFAVCGFFKYHGMNAEQFLWAVIKSELLYPKRLLYRRESVSVLHGGNDSCQGKIWKERGLDDGEETQKEGKSKEKKRKSS